MDTTKHLANSVSNKDTSTSDLEAFFLKPSIQIIIIILLGCILYSNTFSAPFVLDDRRSIVDNKAIQDLSKLIDIQRIDTIEMDQEVKNFIKTRYVGYLSFALNYHLHGLDVTGYHMTNLFIHIINALLIYWLVLLTAKTSFFERDLARSTNFSVIAFFSACLFICHPIQTQAVTYVVQRFASLATLFFLCSLVFYIQFRLASTITSRFVFYSFAIIFTIVAMFTKEISFTLPVVLILYEAFFFKGKIKQRLPALLPFVLTLFVIPLTLMSRIEAQNLQSITASLDIANLKGISRAEYLYTQFRVIITYIRLLFVPVGQNLDYDYEIYHSFFTPEVYLSAILLSAVFIIGIYILYLSRTGEHRHRLLRIISFGIFWFFITLSVESGVVPISDVIFEHRLYLPSVGFFIAVVASLITIRDKLQAASINAYRSIIPLLVLTILTFSVAAYARNDIWRDDVRLWEDTVKKSPAKVRPHYSLALAYFNRNRLDDTIRELKIVLEKQNFALAHHDLGLVYFKQGRYGLAINEYKKAISKNPEYFEAHEDLGVTYAMLGQHNDAIQELKTAATLRPTDISIHKNLGLAYEELGNTDAATSEYSIVVKAFPSFINELNNTGVALFKQGNFKTSMTKYQIVIKLNPDLVQAHYNLALLDEKLNRPDLAIQELKIAINLDPNLATAHYHLALLYSHDGNIKDADRELSIAIKLKPNFDDAIKAYNKLHAEHGT